MLRFRNGKAQEEYERMQDRKILEMHLRRLAMDEKCEKIRAARTFHLKRVQDAEAEKIPTARKDVDERLKQIEHSYRLAEELSRRKKELQKARFNRPKVSVRSSNCDPEEARREQIEAKVKRESENAFLIREWYRNDAGANRQLEQEKFKRESYRAALQDQLMNNRRRKAEMEEEKDRERKAVEEAIEAVAKEDLETRKRKEEDALRLGSDAAAFLEARRVWQEKVKDALKREQENIARIAMEKESKERSAQEKKADISAMRDRMVDQLTKKLIDEEFRRTEREEVCRELYLAEEEERVANEKRESVLKKKRVADELLTDMVRQREALAERKAKDSAVDAAFAKYLTEQRAATEEKERRKEQQQRERNARYADELRDVMIENRVQHAMEILGRRKGEASQD